MGVPWGQAIVGQTEVFPSLRLAHPGYGHREGHLPVVIKLSLFQEMGFPVLITGAPSHSILTEKLSH